MPFNEMTKLTVKRRSHFRCCLCHALGIEIHHIIPQAEGGSDSEDNAAPLCPSCHETYGANPEKRKFIREAREFWYELCEKRYATDPSRLDDIERLLRTIESHVQTSKFPLLPLSLFYTLRHTTNPMAIEHAFRDANGYKSLKTEYLQLVGTARIGGMPPYNPIEVRPNHSHCTLNNHALAALIEEHTGFEESAIKHPLETKLEFYFPSADSDPDTPSLILELALHAKPVEVKTLQLFDDLIFQDAFARGWEVTNPSKKAWSISDLRGARIRLRMEISSYDDINFQRPPRLHNLVIYFGTDAPHILFFSSNQLEHPKIMENKKPEIQWDFSAVPDMTYKPLVMTYEFHVDEELYFNQLKQVG